VQEVEGMPAVARACCYPGAPDGSARLQAEGIRGIPVCLGSNEVVRLESFLCPVSKLSHRHHLVISSLVVIEVVTACCRQSCRGPCC